MIVGDSAIATAMSMLHSKRMLRVEMQPSLSREKWNMLAMVLRPTLQKPLVFLNHASDTQKPLFKILN